MNFSGKTAIVTGAAAGIGKATSILLAQNGCNVVMVDLRREDLQKTYDEITNVSGKVITFECDVSNEQRVYEVVKETENIFGRIDILVNNAGVFRDIMPFTETDSNMWKKYFGINVLGTMYFCKAVIDGMVKNNYGKIINVASVAGVYGIAHLAPYSATKGAVIAFTKALAKEVTNKNVLVNSVSPGSVSSEYDVPAPSDFSFLGRSGTHTENAKLICFLASDDASYISGQNIQIDGCRKKM